MSSQAFPSARSGGSPAFEELYQEFQHRWMAGENPAAEPYIARLSERDSSLAPELIYAEYCLSRRAGLQRDSDSFLKRFPEHQDRLQRLFSLHQTLTTSELGNWLASGPLPDPGDQLGPYRFVRLLGEGGFARVFLAEQSDLEDRLVVVKVSNEQTIEPRLLARLRHRHIVEVTRQASTEDGQLHLICMTFLGGATLWDLLREIRKQKKPKTGADLISILERISAPEYPHQDSRPPALEKIAGLSYSKAIAWFVARLAEALDYADRRAVVHGDIKPSNILISAEGMPLLLDFNLGIDRIESLLGSTPEKTSGTLAYMAPERLKVLLPHQIRASRILPRQHEHRADLYALGLILLEALSDYTCTVKPDPLLGILPVVGDLAAERSQGHLAFKRALKQVPPGLRPLLRRLLEGDPADRYPGGRELAEDLDRWVADRPLLLVESSNTMGQQLRRHRGKLLVGALVVFAFFAAIGIRERQLLIERKKTAQAMYSAVLDDPVGGPFALNSDLFGGLNRPPLPHYLGIRTIGDDAAEWVGRDLQYLNAADRSNLLAHRLETVLDLVEQLVGMSASSSERQRGLKFAGQISSAYSLDAFRRFRSASEAAGIPPTIRTRPPRVEKWLNHYLNGVVAARTQSRAAMAAFEQALAENPELLLARYQLGRIEQRLGLLKAAQTHLKTCVLSQPGSLMLRLRYASVLYRLGDYAGVSVQCAAANRIDPSFKDPYYLMGMLQAVGQDKALSQTMINSFIERSNDQDRDRSRKRFLHYALLLNGSFLDIVPELDEVNLRELVSDYPDDQTLIMFYAYFLERKGRVKEAADQYRKIIRRDPNQLMARFNLAVLIRNSAPGEATTLFLSVMDHPKFEDLIGVCPSAGWVPQRLVEYCLRKGDFAVAQHAAEVGLHFAELRNERPGFAYYAMAMVCVASADTNRFGLVRAAYYLKQAQMNQDELITSGFTTDAFFDKQRVKIETIGFFGKQSEQHFGPKPVQQVVLKPPVSVRSKSNARTPSITLPSRTPAQGSIRQKSAQTYRWAAGSDQAAAAVAARTGGTDRSGLADHTAARRRP